jgi:membrane fusion protein (multidrug efflux system)
MAPQVPETIPSSVAAAAPTKPAGRAKFVFVGLVAAVLIGGGLFYVTGLGHQKTDDAFVEGRVIAIAARVAGQVSAVKVVDNQEVNEGDVLVELDPADLEARRDAAQADLLSTQAQLASAQAQLGFTEKNAEASLTQAQGGLGQANSSVEASRAQLEQAKADLTAAEARLTLAKTELERSKSLFSTGSISKAEVDSRTSTFDQAQAARAQAQSRLISTQAAIDGSVGGVTLAKGRFLAAQTAPQQIETAKAALGLAQARVKQSEAAVRTAQLNLSYTTIRAPSKGVVSRRNVEVGQLVDPSRALLAIVPLHDVWVVANFKEDQLQDMKPGAKAVIEVDAFSSKKLNARVDSIAGGTGSRFALLPPDNASGNFTKVVQRVPVLLRFDSKPDVVLRPGMSVTVVVNTKE